jgi:hypothetical protein
VIMGDEILHGAPQRLLAEEDEAVQARLLDASYKSLGVGIRVSVQMRRIATLRADVFGSSTRIIRGFSECSN